MPTADRLQLNKTWFDDRRLFASWSPPARRLLQQTRSDLQRELRGSLHRTCVHLKSHGGIKGRYAASRGIRAAIATYPASM